MFAQKVTKNALRGTGPTGRDRGPNTHSTAAMTAVRAIVRTGKAGAVIGAS